MIEDRIETVVVARAHTLRSATSNAELVTALARYCPSDVMPAAWAATVTGVVWDATRFGSLPVIPRRCAYSREKPPAPKAAE